jgi:hypothetical protein
MGGPGPEKVSGGEKESQDQAGCRYPPLNAEAAWLPMEAFREALPAQFLIVDPLFGEGIGFGQLRPPG